MLRFFSEINGLQRSALGILILIVILGMVLLALNKLDIDEGYRLNLPINIFNAIFITALAIPLIYISVKMFTRTGSIKLLTLGGAQLALGVGSLLKGWLPNASLYVLVIMFESIVILTSLIYLLGAIAVFATPAGIQLNSSQKIKALVLTFTGILIIILLIIFLSFREIIPASISFRENTMSVQNIMQIVSLLFLFSASFICFRVYLKSPGDLSYWYLLGVLALAFGVFFIAQGPVESRIAWTGRASQYFGNICFLLAVIRSYKRDSINNSGLGYPGKLTDA
jgi:hypothetical protein